MGDDPLQSSSGARDSSHDKEHCCVLFAEMVTVIFGANKKNSFKGLKEDSLTIKFDN